jgi:hypothetical protein
MTLNEKKLKFQRLQHFILQSKSLLIVWDILRSNISFYLFIILFYLIWFMSIRIRREAEPFGICKIIPPHGWNPPFMVDFENSIQFKTKHQKINELQQGQGFDDGEMYNVRSYRQMAETFKQHWINENYDGELTSVSLNSLTQDYWDLVETNKKEITIDYGNDIDSLTYQSGFPRCDDKSLMDKYSQHVDFSDPEYYRLCPWNLNNIPSAPGSLLRILEVPITGINVPWLYFGMLFASFCWHTEDNYFYSVNYNHYGAPKQWYGVPGYAADQFEKVSYYYYYYYYIHSIYELLFEYEYNMLLCYFILFFRYQKNF